MNCRRCTYLGAYKILILNIYETIWLRVIVK